MIRMLYIVQDLSRRSPVCRSEWLIPVGKDIIIGDEGTGMLRAQVQMTYSGLESQRTYCDDLV